MSRFFHPLDEALGTRSKVQVLRVLLEQEGQLSGREVARQAGVADRTARLALDDLERLGLVHRDVSPREHRLRINREHVLVKHGLEGLFTAERRSVADIFDRLRALCAEISLDRDADIRAAWVFGSAMRGEDTLTSDLDLLVLVDDTDGVDQVREELSVEGEAFSQRYGLDLSPVVLTVERLRQMESEGASLTTDLREDARRVFGEMVGEVLDD
jgi:predicted nucleotidyltransferase